MFLLHSRGKVVFHGSESWAPTLARVSLDTDVGPAGNEPKLPRRSPPLRSYTGNFPNPPVRERNSESYTALPYLFVPFFFLFFFISLLSLDVAWEDRMKLLDPTTRANEARRTERAAASLRTFGKRARGAGTPR